MKWIIIWSTVFVLITVSGVWVLVSNEYERRTRIAEAYVKVCDSKGGTVVFNGRTLECLK